MARRPGWQLALELWAAVTLIAAAAQVLLKLQTYQWDTGVYWWAGRAFSAGQSPYGAIPGQPVYLHYIYPPLTAAFFAPFGHLSIGVVKVLWIVAKALAFWMTVRLWRRATGVRATIVPPLFFFTFAFGSALLVDFTAGNIAVFEQCVLWYAFAALLARRPWVFVAAVVFIAQFKLTPIFFLGALLVVDERPRWREFLGGSVLFGLTLLANFAFYPARVKEFLVGLSSVNERGWGDPATLGVMQDLVDQIRGLGVPIPAATAYALYGAAVAAVFYFSVRWLNRHRSAGTVSRVEVVLVTLVVYALVMPRMKDYSYVALLPAAWYVLARPVLQEAPMVVLAALIPRPLPQLDLRLPLLTQAYVYAPLLGALAVWLELIRATPSRETFQE